MKSERGTVYWLPAVIIAVCLHVILLLQIASYLRGGSIGGNEGTGPLSVAQGAQTRAPEGDFPSTDKVVPKASREPFAVEKSPPHMEASAQDRLVTELLDKMAEKPRLPLSSNQGDLQAETGKIDAQMQEPTAEASQSHSQPKSETLQAIADVSNQDLAVSVVPVPVRDKHDVFQQAVSFLASQPPRACTLVMPQLLDEGKVGLFGIADHGDHVEEVIAQYQDELGTPVVAQFAPITKPQCKAIAFAQSHGISPNVTLRIALKKAVLKNGGSLEGEIRGQSGPMHLLLVDDEGVLQKMDGLLRPVIASGQQKDDNPGKALSFATPLTITGEPVLTAQLLVAVRSDVALDSLDRFVGNDATSFFDALQSELEERDLSIDMAFAAFVVKP